MARLIALVSLILFTVLALAGPLDLLVAERPVARRTIQHAPLRNLEARAPNVEKEKLTTHVVVVKTQTSYVTTFVAATTTVKPNKKHPKVTTVTITGYGQGTTTVTETETETCYETQTVTVPQYGCTTTTVAPTVSVMPRAAAHKRAQGNQALYAREFA